MTLKFALAGKVVHEYEVRSIEVPDLPRKGENIIINEKEYFIKDFDIFTEMVLYSITLI